MNANEFFFNTIALVGLSGIIAAAFFIVGELLLLIRRICRKK